MANRIENSGNYTADRVKLAEAAANLGKDQEV